MAVEMTWSARITFTSPSRRARLRGWPAPCPHRGWKHGPGPAFRRDVNGQGAVLRRLIHNDTAPPTGLCKDQLRGHSQRALESEPSGYEEGVHGAQYGRAARQIELADTHAVPRRNRDTPSTCTGRCAAPPGEIQRVGGLRTVPGVTSASSPRPSQISLCHCAAPNSGAISPMDQHLEASSQARPASAPRISPLAEHFIRRHELRLNWHPVSASETAEASAVTRGLPQYPAVGAPWSGRIWRKAARCLAFWDCGSRRRTAGLRQCLAPAQATLEPSSGRPSPPPRLFWCGTSVRWFCLGAPPYTTEDEAWSGKNKR